MVSYKLLIFGKGTFALLTKLESATLPFCVPAPYAAPPTAITNDDLVLKACVVRRRIEKYTIIAAFILSMGRGWSRDRSRQGTRLLDLSEERTKRN
jgi:hypothetical protein